MTNDRPYRKAFTHEEALAEINRCINKQFDPIVVDAFLGAVKQGWTENPHR
jgi:HD-GYP domain-containing protein (c-di-GMP phosphodiesterase class II)